MKIKRGKYSGIQKKDRVCSFNHWQQKRKVIFIREETGEYLIVIGSETDTFGLKAYEEYEATFLSLPKEYVFKIK